MWTTSLNFQITVTAFDLGENTNNSLNRFESVPLDIGGGGGNPSITSYLKEVYFALEKQRTQHLKSSGIVFSALEIDAPVR